jgi:signal transduction histidine kinase
MALADTPPGADDRGVLPLEYAAGHPRDDDLTRPALYADHVNRSLSAWWQKWRASTARDVISAALVTAVLVAAAYAEAHPKQASDRAVFRSHQIPHMPAAALLLVAVACLVLAVKRRAPVAVLLVSTAAIVAYSALGFVNGAALLAPAIALFAVAQVVPVRQALVLAGITLVALMTATGLANPFGATGGGFYLIPALIAAPLFGGIAVSNRRAYVNSIAERAEQDALRRVDEERLRIARELHDIVAHSMATITVQAAAAEHVLKSNPDAAVDALRAIRLASKDGLRELRAILNVLRQADEGDPAEPAPGLAQVDALVSGACAAGLPTTLRQDGTPSALPAGVDLAAYRIIQESLTNAIRHAGPARATITLSYCDTALRIEVTDTGRGGAPGGQGASIGQHGGGHGIVGMRERATAAGGTLQVGPGPDGGYRVVAVLPADRPSPRAEAESKRTGTGSRS